MRAVVLGALLIASGCDRVLGLDKLTVLPPDAPAADGPGGIDAADLSCPPGYTQDPLTRSRYRATTTSLMFVAAANDCAHDETLGTFTGHTHLAVISDDLERRTLGIYVEYWVGLTDLKSPTNTFSWVSTEPPPPQPWAPGEPNNAGSEDCAVYKAGEPALLNNVSCTDTRMYVCECDIYTNVPATYQ